MRILWVSDSPSTPSGFGTVTREVCSRLAERGHRIEIVGWQAHGTTSRWRGIPVHPVRHDTFGADVLLGYLLRHRPDFVVTLGDVWWMSFLTEPAVQQYLDQSGGRWVLYYPVDGADPDGKLPSGWVRVLETADVPVCISRFGAQVSAACGVESHYIPHGCDTDLFCPPSDKTAAKARLGHTNCFVVLSDARNQPRKLLPRTLDIAAAFCKGKDDVVFHLHTDPDDEAARTDLYRYRLRADITELGLQKVVRFTPDFRMRATGGLEPADLAPIYAAADVHLLSSWGEGFGLPTLQAASAGVVPMAVAYSASHELVEGHGVGVAAESAIVDEFGLVRCLLSREAAVEALERLYRDRSLLAGLSERARRFALDYRWDDIVKRWEHTFLHASPRRKPVRTRAFEWTAGESATIAALPEPVVEAVSESFAPLPDGTKVSVQLTERRYGEIASEIRRNAFAAGDELSIPVRLPAAFDEAPRARMGHLLVSPADLGLAARLKRIFPGIRVSVPRPDGDPSSDELPTLEEVVPALPFYSLVVDYSSDSAPNIDVACAALGVPYAGPGALWPAIPDGDPVHQLRRLLTDQGFSEWRRVMAAQEMERVYGRRSIESLRALALEGIRAARGQSSPDATSAERDPEMFLVRAEESTSEGAREEIAEYVARCGGFVLMATGGGSLIISMPQGGKEILEAHPEVGFVGGVTFDDQGKAVRALKSLFARNAAMQLIARDNIEPVVERG